MILREVSVFLALKTNMYVYMCILFVLQDKLIKWRKIKVYKCSSVTKTWKRKQMKILRITCITILKPGEI